MNDTDARLIKAWRVLCPEAGVYTLPVSGQKVTLWYDKNGNLHINGMGVADPQEES